MQQRITIKEIEQLLRLNGWSRTRLAAELNMTENAVLQWFHRHHKPGGPACVLMRLWLAEAIVIERSISVGEEV